MPRRPGPDRRRCRRAQRVERSCAEDALPGRAVGIRRDRELTTSGARALAPLHLADEGAREVVDHDHAARHLVGRQTRFAEIADGVGFDLDALAQDDRRGDVSPPLDLGSATTAAPAMSGWEVSTSSTSLGETLKPPVMMISFSRSTMVTKPSGETEAMSPVRSPSAVEERGRRVGRPVPVPLEHLRTAQEELSGLAQGEVDGRVVGVDHPISVLGNGTPTVPGRREGPIGLPSATGDDSVMP